MRVGIGLPTTLAGVPGEMVIEWARRAEDAGFSSLGVLDRLLYDSYEPFVALSAAAAATQDIRLVTMIAIGPLRNTALLAKQAASLHRLSGGRLTLGLAVGARRDDYEGAGVEYRTRGQVLTEQVYALPEQWAKGEIGPRLDDRPDILVGGSSAVAFERAARFGDGYVHGGGPPRAFGSAAAKAVAAWSELGRPGRPKLWGQGYFGLGGEAEKGAGYLRDYYSFTGPFAERIVEENLTTPQKVVQFVRGYREEGCDELVLLPTVADLAQIDLLAEALS
jgi:alkanesulfonate monooxygenase SsuD/methylene tetrahydromethanopterin reductase-like flavin-dependent oxidoreductase (luciferase family)